MFIYSAISSFDFTQDFGQEIKDTQKQLSKQNITVKRLKVRLKKFFFIECKIVILINALKIVKI